MVRDRPPALTLAEVQALARHTSARQRNGHVRRWPKRLPTDLVRVFEPLQEGVAAAALHHCDQTEVLQILGRETLRRRRACWGWTAAEWAETLDESSEQFRRQHHAQGSSRFALLAVSYLLGRSDVWEAWKQRTRGLRVGLARRVFGRERVDHATQTVETVLARWGYRPLSLANVREALCEALLAVRSPNLSDLRVELLETLRAHATLRHVKDAYAALSRALCDLGVLARPLGLPAELMAPKSAADAGGTVAPEWVAWCQRWRDTTTLRPHTRTAYYGALLRAGRWLASQHPAVVSPEQWTRDVAAEYVAMVDRVTAGQWTERRWLTGRGVIGKPLTAGAKAHQITALRAFFRDAQEWGWIARRFDPRRALAIPPTIYAALGPNPRVIADDVWAKLLWAGLTLSEHDLPGRDIGSSSEIGGDGGTSHARRLYPLAFVRAVTVVWLFAGLRNNEIRRLRVGCIRWQQPPELETQYDPKLLAPLERREGKPGSLREQRQQQQRQGGQVGQETTTPTTILAAMQSTPSRSSAICLLDVPPHKTGPAFTKPVDPLVGEAITAWEAARPEQPPFLDVKTGTPVHYLFAYRGRRLGLQYVNETLIPLLCRRAGVPATDARGTLTSHRARATIATQLFNAKVPFSLYELQAWLGHRTPAATQYYAKLSPTKLARAYAAADYFSQNVRTISVLLDRDAVARGSAVGGAPWRYYDLGHGYCTYDFFDQCPHRMACAKCSFYVPKGSSRAQAVEGKVNLLRMLQEIPLTEDERAAVEDGVAALEGLVEQLTNVPTPAGPTPHQLHHMPRGEHST